jgi:hypothetical protein
MSQEIKHLFRKRPTLEIVEQILQALHFTGLEDGRTFKKGDIDLTAFEELLPLLEPYYLPCKAKLFLYEFSQAKGITVIRHLLRAHGYKLHVYEKVSQGVKQTLYQIERDAFAPLMGSMDVSFA